MKSFVIISSLLSISLVSCKGESIKDQDSTDSTTDQVIEKTAYETVEFESLDSLLISANLYEVDPSFPIMVLCHQRGFCKYEYAGVAERFNDMGFNCLAIDQRCGGPIADQPNETWLRAKEQNKPTDFLDAEQDIEAAINCAYDKYNRPVILLGSSYSSTLCIYQALDNDKVSSVIAFSPGNYFFYDGVKEDLVEKMRGFQKPFFFTAAKQEIPIVRELVLGHPRTERQLLFAPEGEGWHGARALWPTQQDGEEYWTALEDFLKVLKGELTKGDLIVN